ncbi:MAG: hypothetical protein JO025_25780 [Verrucomicrobia bacterium]|nr:hypothetical protein [Verrucomicrobiota bacterium]
MSRKWKRSPGGRAVAFCLKNSVSPSIGSTRLRGI